MIRRISYLKEPVLRKVTSLVKNFDKELHNLIDDMFETMYDAKGVGLAAPQIGLSLNLSVIDVSDDRSKQLVIANPVIISSKGEEVFSEGCLSIPGAYSKVIRAKEVSVKAQDKFGEFFEITAEGLLGECLQHEIDHLNGKLFIDLLSPLKNKMARRKHDKFLLKKEL